MEVAPGVAVTSEKFIVNKMVEGIRGRTDVTESSDVLKEYPERFTNSDVENLFRLFRKIAIRATAEKFGLKLSEKYIKRIFEKNYYLIIYIYKIDYLLFYKKANGRRKQQHVQFRK